MIKATPAFKPLNKEAVIVPYFYAATLILMLVLQLLTFEDFVEAISHYLVNGANVAAVVISLIEVFSLPFLLRINLSPLARVCSAIFSISLPVLWIVMLIQVYAQDIIVNNVGLFGRLFPQALGLTVLLELALLQILAVAAFIILRGPLLFDKSLRK